jgi:hypothetical protein
MTARDMNNGTATGVIRIDAIAGIATDHFGIDIATN